jgi:hypothetical protein
MNHILRFFTALILTSLAFNGCRTSTDPNTGIQPGMRATINGTLWVADTAIAVKTGTCLIVMGWTGSGSARKEISISMSSAAIAPDSCGAQADYVEGINELIKPSDAFFLASKTSSNVQGTFAFHGVVFRSTNATNVINGEFNVGMQN